VSTISLGTALAVRHHAFSPPVFALTLATAVLLQVLSNLANDLGDFLKGADRARVGQIRTVQAGLISRSAMTISLLATTALVLISGSLLIWNALGQRLSAASLAYALLGLLATGAALAYTLGKKPFGYQGFGDAAVFIFFGFVGVCGSLYLQTHTLTRDSLLPAIAMGALATGVLNINNMRDLETDKNAGKKTLAVRLGMRKAKIYHHGLAVLAFAATGVFAMQLGLPLVPALIVLPVIMLLFAGLSIAIDKTRIPARLEPFLKVHSLFTLVYALGLGGLLCFS
jgi:1,4-dihydroxy-2-naphthoate octaprenyltransferase